MTNCNTFFKKFPIIFASTFANSAKPLKNLGKLLAMGLHFPYIFFIDRSKTITENPAEDSEYPSQEERVEQLKQDKARLKEEIAKIERQFKTFQAILFQAILSGNSTKEKK